jgi:hypothetical protein
MSFDEILILIDVDAPVEIIVGTIFLYSLLGKFSCNYRDMTSNSIPGVSCFWGLAVTCLFLPLNHFAGKVVVGAQENLMKARDERVSLMNEVHSNSMPSLIY